MIAAHDPPAVEISRDCMFVCYLSAVDASPCEEAIDAQAIDKVVVECWDAADGSRVIHWFVCHREGWTVHFNDQFGGAAEAILWLQARFGFEVPQVENIAGEVTTIWERPEKSRLG